MCLISGEQWLYPIQFIEEENKEDVFLMGATGAAEGLRFGMVPAGGDKDQRGTRRSFRSRC